MRFNNIHDCAKVSRRQAIDYSCMRMYCCIAQLNMQPRVDEEPTELRTWKPFTISRNETHMTRGHVFGGAGRKEKFVIGDTLPPLINHARLYDLLMSDSGSHRKSFREKLHLWFGLVWGCQKGVGLPASLYLHSSLS